MGEPGAGARAGAAQKAGGERQEGAAAPHRQVREIGKSTLNRKFVDGSTVGYRVCQLQNYLAPFVEKKLTYSMNNTCNKKLYCDIF